MANAETIKKNFNLFKSRLAASPDTEEELLIIEEEEPAVTVIIEQRPEPQPVTPVVETPAPVPQNTVTQTTQPVAQPQTQPQTQTQPQPQTTTQQTQTTQTTQAPAPVQTRDRNIFFAQVSSDGQINHFRVTRRIPVSDSPMQDVLKILLTGPSSDEIGRGILNLIPQNTRVLTATVRGNTAYINFSEDFLFNTYGVEGYVAQLRQIVWTVTEFQNVNDVQILIEGRRFDYLGEGIWIGSPISRQSF